MTEEAIIHAAMRADGHKRTAAGASSRQPSTAMSRFIRGDYAPVAVLAVLMIGLGAYIYTENDRYLSAFNTSSVMLLCAALGFISLGQTIALLLGGIDLSVGPLSGFLVVVGSFFITDEKSAFVWIVGFVLMGLCGARDRTDQRSAHSISEVHTRGRNPRDVHRAPGSELRTARFTGGNHQS